jgi:glycosyltransferase involved in cell wall biosynthesis
LTRKPLGFGPFLPRYHQSMRIVLDATPLSVPTGGVARYTAELSRALAQGFDQDEFWLLSDQPYSHPGPELQNLRCGPGPQNVLERRWWLWGLQGVLGRLKADLFHGTDYAVPYLPVRATVMTLHDLSPWLDAAWHSAAERVRSRTPLLLRLGLATLVITPSTAVRRQAIERFGLAEDRVVTVPLAASALFRPVALSGRRQPYFLYVGTLEPRKNVTLIIEAWRELRKRFDADLILAGRRRDDFPAPEPQAGLHVLGAVPDERLPELYSGAIACLYPSFYEGFGLPVLEAMQCGAAVIASDDPAIAETAGGAAELLDPRSPPAWVAALEAALEKPEWTAALREKALRRAAEFSWSSTATLTREVYAEAVRRFRKQT